MRRAVIIAALMICSEIWAMPLGLRTAMWGIAPSNRRVDVDAVFPALDGEATIDNITAALDTAVDSALAENITNATDYAEFREWAKYRGAATVKANESAWLSFALGADALIGRGLTAGDVKIESFYPAADISRFELIVSIKNVNIGGGTVAEETLKRNLKKVIGVEGAPTLASEAFSSDNIEITFDAPVDGKARFTATPPSNSGNSFFMRVKVK
jgi:hypothetical protein